MHINFMPFLVVWIALALAVVYLFLRHRKITGQEDAHLDVLEAPAVAQQQAILEHQLAVVDKWGKTLTIIAAAYGLLLVVAFFYQSWYQLSNFGG
jgi:hypothetical protein